ncbi:MAG: outer membrane homotrimeric porin [Mailhella sp.]|nr:outer membrane homotrimeric porin [Mailhella sp.]
MKKLLTLLLAAGMSLTAAQGASAVELKVSGTYDFSFSGSEGLNGSNSFMDASDYRHYTGRNHNERHFDVYQRWRIGFEFVASEQLSAFYQAQIGTFVWGGPYKGASKAEADGGALATRAANIVTRLAYLDWMIPQTDIHIRMGQQSILLPNYVAGSPILDDPATGVVIAAPVNDWFDVSAFWLRAIADPLKTSSGEYEYDDADVDLFGLVANMKLNRLRLTPWAIYGHGGKNFADVRSSGPTSSGILPFNGMDALRWENGALLDTPSGSDTSLWFAGIGAEFKPFDPLRLALDFYYSGTSNDHSSTERDGWYLAGLASYKTDWCEPALVAWYASGDDSNVTNGSEQPLTLSGGFDPGARAYFNGRYSIANTIDRGDAGGTWGVSAQLNKLSFIQGLYHDLAVTYFKGTNDNKLPNIINNVYGGDVTPADYLTDKDHIVEVDFNTSYHIYKNLITVLELSYLFQDIDSSVWRTATGENRDFSNAWRAALNFRYKF